MARPTQITRQAAVVGEHVQEHQPQPDGPADQAGPQRVGAQGGADGGDSGSRA